MTVNILNDENGITVELDVVYCVQVQRPLKAILI